MRRSMLAAAAASASATRMASSSTSVSMRSAAALLSSSSSSFSSSSSRTFATLSDIRASQLTVKRTTNPKPRLPKEQLKFGQCTTDHMLEIDWTAESGWGAPRIVPYAPLQLDPAASCLHYGLEAFEGLKAYVDDADRIRLFRPDKNMARLNGSAHRLLMPTFDGEQFAECIKELVRIEKSWIPRGMGYSLYLRPTIISTYPYLGVQPTRSVKLYVICSPVGPYYPTGFNPVKLFADPVHVRAWPGGTGMAKCGGNYAMGMRPAMEAAAKGYSQVLWLFGDDLQVTEVGTMNQFFFWINESGQRELITAPLDGTILAGVTRDSILYLTRGWGEFAVTERKYTLHEVIKAVKEDRMLEAFGAGTAAIVSPVEAFAFKDVEYKIPLNKVDPKAKAGPLTQRISDTLMGIQYGKIPHEWSVIVPE